MLLSKDQIEDLLSFIGVDDILIWKGDRVQFCCPIHHESHPSCGINADFSPPDSNLHLQVFHCFSCGEKGTLDWFLYRSMPDTFKNLNMAREFLKERYHITFLDFGSQEDGLELKRYEDFFVHKNKKFVVPYSNLAPYMSGKETYQYFFDRGFTKKTVKKFMIGRDLEFETITIPIFWEDNSLAGIIGRYISPNVRKNSRYKVYSFPKSALLFPINHFIPAKNGEVILVEGILDAIYMHQLGYTNTLSPMTNGMSFEQVKMLLKYSDTFISFFDNDKGGKTAYEITNKLMDKRARLKTVEYPMHGKDPCDLNSQEISNMIKNAKGILKNPIRRL